jgi:hypothetical protein
MRRCRTGPVGNEVVGSFYLQVLDITDLDQLRLVAEEILPHAPGR